MIIEVWIGGQGITILIWWGIWGVSTGSDQIRNFGEREREKEREIKEEEKKKNHKRGERMKRTVAKRVGICWRHQLR